MISGRQTRTKRLVWGDLGRRSIGGVGARGYVATQGELRKH